MGLAMPEQGLCMYQMDLEGHGYSGGERAYIEDYNHWVDDYRQVYCETRRCPEVWRGVELALASSCLLQINRWGFGWHRDYVFLCEPHPTISSARRVVHSHVVAME